MGQEEPLRTPLEPRHRELGAKMGAFAGWEMPIEYEGVLAEYRAVRERVGVFDVSHLGKLEIRGSGALATLQGLLSNDLARVDVGGAQYTLMLNESGGVEEDLIVYRLGDQRWFLVPNASNTAKVLGSIRTMARDAEVLEHPGWCVLGVQGPRSLEVVGTLFPPSATLPFMSAALLRYRGSELVVARSGYTGELGFELLAPAEVAGSLWDEVMDVGAAFAIAPAGLAVRDVLRLEMGYPLWGQDLVPERTPLEAGLGWAVALDKQGGFTGREALLRQREEGVGDRLRGLITEDRRYIPRPHYEVFADDNRVGEITSGTFSPMLERGIALAYLSPDLGPREEIQIEIRGRRGAATVVAPPFVGRSPR